MLNAPHRSCLRTKSGRAPSPFIIAAALALLSAFGLALWVPRAWASATPVGQLVNETVSTVNTSRAALVAVALPHPPEGQVWRLARDVDAKILVQVSEAKVGANVVIVFAATGAGTVRVVFAQTHGESATVSRAITHVVTVH